MLSIPWWYSLTIDSQSKFLSIIVGKNHFISGLGKNHKDAASVRATNPIPAACGLYYYEVKIVSKGRDGYVSYNFFVLFFILFYWNAKRIPLSSFNKFTLLEDAERFILICFFRSVLFKSTCFISSMNIEVISSCHDKHPCYIWSACLILGVLNSFVLDCSWLQSCRRYSSSTPNFLSSEPAKGYEHWLSLCKTN